ncbi:hypothetical protein THASP1DRAFT_35476 [Thamnocephalis sphaerospora]|uniref:Dynein light chain roadblock n=1 Tax=Thamnocephalis sphaerospora TaxID=78915 RepID=A0A4P9XGD9_9FUNG|nr:hypothetical protein THASP1DRAFT_35476 [Thamnocephalis sphaerospora]|eukprot:RKP04672.1 hypothetical protein THASP1DRAFT_35476 [Thamnocephalis sphaerospora]
MAASVAATLNRLATRKGVHGVVILNRQGMAIRSTLPADLTRQYAHLLNALVVQARNTVRDLDSDGQNELTFMRIRTKKHEIMVAPNHDYLLIVVQNPQEQFQP